VDYNLRHMPDIQDYERFAPTVGQTATPTPAKVKPTGRGPVKALQVFVESGQVRWQAAPGLTATATEGAPLDAGMALEIVGASAQRFHAFAVVDSIVHFYYGY
jgi:hypothetical protein